MRRTLVGFDRALPSSRIRTAILETALQHFTFRYEAVWTGFLLRPHFSTRR